VSAFVLLSMSGVLPSGVVLPSGRGPPSGVGVVPPPSLLDDEQAYTTAREPRIKAKGRIRRFIISRA
jgi:hypothetical protein